MDTSLWVQIASIILGGVVGTGIGVWVTRRALTWQVRAEMTVKIMDDYFNNYDSRNRVKSLLEPNNFPKGRSAEDIRERNKIRKVGDWYELVAILYEDKFINRRIFNKLGLEKQMCEFANAVKCYDVLKPDKSWKSLMALG